MNDSFDAPVEVSDVQLAFPGNVMHLMPAFDDIPSDYRSNRRCWEQRLWIALFFFGLADLELLPAEGIDPDKAFRHLRCIAGSFEPKHEHKEAALAYLTSRWFVGAWWKLNDGQEDCSENWQTLQQQREEQQ